MYTTIRVGRNLRSVLCRFDFTWIQDLAPSHIFDRIKLFSYLSYGFFLMEIEHEKSVPSLDEEELSCL